MKEAHELITDALTIAKEHRHSFFSLVKYADLSDHDRAATATFKESAIKQ